MAVLQIVEIVVSALLFLFVCWTLADKQKKNYKKITIIAIINLILIGHVGINVLHKHSYIQNDSTKQASAQTTQRQNLPVISLKGEKEIYLEKGQKYQEAGYSAIDNNNKSIVNRVKVEKQVTDENTYKLIYKVRDERGNTAEEERVIHTKEKQVNNKQTQCVQNDKKQEKPQKNNKPKSEKGVIYLTFDDGPSNSSTPKILDILKRENVKATFFLLNYTKSTEHLVKREVAEGHSVGIHGYSHDYKKIYKSEKAYMNNLNKLQDKIYKSTGVKTVLTRFPGGSSNVISSFNPKIMTKLTKRVVKEGYRYYDWNVTSGDSGDVHTAKGVYNKVKKELSKKNRNIVLMHDFAGNDKTIQALEMIIKYGKKHGYRFEAITEKTPMMKHQVWN